MKIDIITHCYNPPETTVYEQMLKWQYASLHNYPPRNVQVNLVIAYTPDDELTTRRIRRCQDFSETRDMITITPLPLEPSRLFRRAIGRNEAALKTDADVIWFTDVDYLFGAGCLDVATGQCLMEQSRPLHMPERYWISYDHDATDEDRAKNDRPHHAQGAKTMYRELLNDLPMIRPDEFASKEQTLCIGGMQIVNGQWARENGYLRDEPRWQEPVDPAMGFKSCRCDAAFRRRNNLKAKRDPIPNLFRLRHEIDGRDYDMKGKRVGKEAW